MKSKSYAKVNIFLKIIGFRGSYHEIASRFMLVKNLYDIVKFEKTSFHDEFILEGDFSCPANKNTIYKIYQELSDIPKVKDFFKTHKVVVQKHIPEFAGLGGGSSNAATFLNMVDDILNLGLTLNEKVEISKKIGSDIPFFIYGYDSANVTGVGEIVEKYDEEALNLHTFTPAIKCSTKEVYKKYRENFKAFDKELANKLLKMNSKDILENFLPLELNDLMQPCLELYPDLEKYTQDRFFSGSGSSVFWIENN